MSGGWLSRPELVNTTPTVFVHRIQMLVPRQGHTTKHQSSLRDIRALASQASALHGQTENLSSPSILHRRLRESGLSVPASILFYR